MTLGITGIIAAYILLALLLLSINLYSKWSWHIKAATIVLTSAFYIITYFSLPALLGWPTYQNPPTQFRLLAAHVEHCLLYTSPSPRDRTRSRMPSSA